jgi:hypothetical protein
LSFDDASCVLDLPFGLASLASEPVTMYGIPALSSSATTRSKNRSTLTNGSRNTVEFKNQLEINLLFVE